jgi:hypothetical protein
MLCEGASIRAVERITGVHRDTIMRLGVRMGEGSQRILDEKMRNLPCRLPQVDEVWGYVGMKQKTALRNRASADVGDVWTWVALDSETKLVPTFAVGDRSGYMSDCFIEEFSIPIISPGSTFQRCAARLHGRGRTCVRRRSGLRLNRQNL